MSWQAVKWVFGNSRARPMARLLLLAIAEAADSAGGGAWPSVDELTRKTGMSKRNVRYATASLVSIGELAVEKVALGGRSRNTYRVLMGATVAPHEGATPAPVEVQDLHPNGATPAPHEVQDLHPAESNPCTGQVQDLHRSGATPSLSGAGVALGVLYTNHQEPPMSHPLGELPFADEVASAPKPKNSRRPDPLWDALMDVCGIDTTQITDNARKAYNGAVKALRKIQATPEQIYERAAIFRRIWPTASLTPTALVRRWAELAPTSVPAGANSTGSLASFTDKDYTDGTF